MRGFNSKSMDFLVLFQSVSTRGRKRKRSLLVLRSRHVLSIVEADAVKRFSNLRVVPSFGCCTVCQCVVLEQGVDSDTFGCHGIMQYGRYRQVIYCSCISHETHLRNIFETTVFTTSRSITSSIHCAPGTSHLRQIGWHQPCCKQVTRVATRWGTVQPYFSYMYPSRPSLCIVRKCRTMTGMKCMRMKH